jgi:lipopolysaccharide export system permease protein
LVPFVAAVMILLSISFVFGPLRSVGAGHRILTGALVGVGFFVVNQMFTYLGIVFTFNPIVTAMLPALFAILLAMSLLRRVH